MKLIVMLGQQSGGWQSLAMVEVIIVLIVLLVVLAMTFQMLGLYVRALVSGAPVTLVELLGMRLRKTPADKIIAARIMARREGLDVSVGQLESHVLAGGDVVRAVSQMITAKRRGIEITWECASTCDLAGWDALDAIESGKIKGNERNPNVLIGRR